MTDEERDIYLRAMLTGTAEAANAALIDARGTGVTVHELLALDELDLIELVHEDRSGSSGSQASLDPVVTVIGLTGVGVDFAEDSAPDPT